MKKPLNIIFTGGSSGIGEAVAIEPAKDKNRFCLIGRNQEKLKNVVKKLIH